MITNLSLNDKTQVMILEALKGTEELLRIASGSDNVEITVMTDACPAHNVTRMLDGHFTGTVTKVTDTKEPFVPVGTTVLRIGFASGSMMLTKVLSVPQPST